MNVWLLILIGVLVSLICTGYFLIVIPRLDERKDIWRSLDWLGISGKTFALLRIKWFTPWKGAEEYTPKGVYIWGTVKVPKPCFRIIDEGIDKLLESIEYHHPEWKWFRKHSDYGIIFLDKMAVNRAGTPALIISSLGYPQVQSAGTTLGTKWKPFVNDDGSYRLQGTAVNRIYLVLPHQDDVQWRYADYLRDSVRNEGEHAIEFINDYDGEFTSHLGPNDVHPHFPLPNEKPRDSSDFNCHN